MSSKEAKAAIEFCQLLWKSDFQKSLKGECLVQGQFPPDVFKAFYRWIEAHDQEIYDKRSSENEDDIRKAAVDDLRLAAAKAYCVVKFTYAHSTQEQSDRHIAYDAGSTANKAWLIQAVDGFLAGIAGKTIQPTVHITCDECGTVEVK